MEPTFLEIVLRAHDLTAAHRSRDDLEVPLEAALKESGLGTVTGGGSGSESSIIEVEAYDHERVPEVLALLQQVLRANQAPASTVIKQLEPELKIHTLF